jgi:DNA-binding transcriptional ArsR family regulator
MPLGLLCSVLGEKTRWKILRELAKGEPLPVKELAGRTGRSSDVAQKHLAMLKEAKIVVQGYGRHYKLAPGIQPDPGSAVLDLGHCVIRLDVES